jgi:hypothetical protein
LGLALGLALLLVPAGGAQSGMQTSPVQGPVYTRPPGFGQSPDTDPVEEEKRLRMLNVDRQKALVADTAKLLKLAGELNAEIQSANAGSLTPAQLHKVAQIEKLAHSVKEKMSTSVRETPLLRQPAIPLTR